MRSDRGEDGFVDFDFLDHFHIHADAEIFQKLAKIVVTRR